MPVSAVSRELLESLADEAAEAVVEPVPQTNRGRSNGRTFDIDGFIERHGLDVDGPEPYEGGRRWRFRHSPLCDHHGDGPFLIQFANGALSAGCHHDSCPWGWQELRDRFEPRRRLHEPGDTTLPEVLLPGGAQTISATGARLGGLFGPREVLFLRGGVVTRVRDGHTLDPARPAEMASDFEQVARLIKRAVVPGGAVTTVPATCNETTAKVIMSAESFKRELPILQLVSPCPLLVERDGQLVLVTGYDRQSGILAGGAVPETVPLTDAVELINGLLTDFRFVDPHDRSRAIAAIVTPGLVLGDLLGARAANDMTEADKSQTGKGYRNKLTAAIYNQRPAVVSQTRGGIGSLEEAFDAALIAGKMFIVLDNIRGKVDSPKIESFLTEDYYNARCAFSPNTQIDPKRVVVMLTSNRAELTDDLSNRSSIVRILKQPAGYVFREYPEERDLLAHVIANQPLYLGAVFAVIRAWHAAGKPRTSETRHDFRVWAQVMDWIVQNIFHAPNLMDGHRETQARVTSPALNWLREVALAVEQQGREDEWLIASRLLDIIDNDGGIEIPGVRAGQFLEDDTVHRAVVQQIGRRLGQAFGGENRLAIDRLVIEREAYRDESRRERYRYRVTTAGEGGAGTCRDNGRPGDAAPDAAPDTAPDNAPDNPRVAPDAPDDPSRGLCGPDVTATSVSGASGASGADPPATTSPAHRIRPRTRPSIMTY